MKNSPLILIAILLTFISSTYAQTSSESRQQTFFQDEPCPLSVILPTGWVMLPDARERWGGKDPTVAFNHPYTNGVQATYYGLNASRFHSAEEFLQYLKRVFNEPELEKEIQINGRRATLFRFRYSYDGYTSSHGAYIPAEAVFEEFVIVPLERGFYAFTLTLSRTQSNPFAESPKVLNIELEQNQRKIREWNEFLNSVEFQKVN